MIRQVKIIKRHLFMLSKIIRYANMNHLEDFKKSKTNE